MPTHSKSISSLTSDIKMKAVTTPFPRLDFMRALILPYQIYEVLARSVPKALLPDSDSVRSTLSSNCSGCPLDTHFALEASPRYSVLDCMLSRFLNLKSSLLHTGAGTHELRENELRGSQPPRQKAPTPHWPYSEGGWLMGATQLRGLAGHTRATRFTRWTQFSFSAL